MRPAYLDPERVMAALRAARAEAVWPGWGFLAEDPGFVERLESAGIRFLGPRAETMRALGDKMSSKQLAEAVGVPLAAWSGGAVAREGLRERALEVGFPLVLKATAGGGGRGIRIVRDPSELERAFDSASGEAAHAFGDGTLFMEALIEGARHIEVQMAADRQGGVLALGLRDCSLQRRHQKVIEEGPPPGVPASLQQAMRDASVRLMRKAGYEGVATCEYLVCGDRFYFLEVNPRLQVEHGITEELTRFDLVKTQVRIALGRALPAQAPSERGHAIEARLCAEDPAADFAPSPGRIVLLDLPAGPGIRVDSGVSLHETIPSEFDSMIAKVIAYGETRNEARARLVRALSDLRVVVEGGMTNKGLLLDVLEHADFRNASCDTRWLDEAGPSFELQPSVRALIAASILSYQWERGAVRLNFYAEASRGRPRQIPPSTGLDVDLVYAGRPYRLKVFAIGDWAYRIYLGDRVVQVRLLEQGVHQRQLLMGGERASILFSESDVELRIEIDGKLHRVLRDVGGKVRAQAPGLVIEMAVRPGDVVGAGQRLGLLEAMKTETAFSAPLAGVVREVMVRAGERVAAGDVLLTIESTAEPARAASVEQLALELPDESDPLDALLDPGSGRPDLSRASALSGAEQAEVAGVLRSETLRILMGYDVNPERAERLVEVLEAPLDDASAELCAELTQLAGAVGVFADIEALFSREPTRAADDELGPSNDARMSMYLRRLNAEGAGIDPGFLDQLRRTLAHYSVRSLEPSDPLQRGVLRCYATRTTQALRSRLVLALIGLLIRLGARGETFTRQPGLLSALDRLAPLRSTVGPAVADLAAQAHFLLFERGSPEEARPSEPVDEMQIVPAPDPGGLEARARELGLDVETARRIELWRLDNFELERIETFPGIHAFHGRARTQPGDERVFCFAEVTDLGPGVPEKPDLARFERAFHEAIEAMRSIQAVRDPAHRMQWNRLYLFLRPPIVLTPELAERARRRLSPETGHLGLEKVIVRLASVDPDRPDADPKGLEVVTGNPTRNRVELEVRAVHANPLAPTSPYERRVAQALGRGQLYPYEVVRLFCAAPARPPQLPGDATGAGTFQEYDLVDGQARPVKRSFGGNDCGIVFGRIETPTRVIPEGMARVLILGDPTRGLGALAAPECDRICAALDLAEREGIPVEWVAVSSGARIAMDSGTENLDATARVVRRIVTFTDAGGEINLILPGLNVGAQSYFDALATMGMETRGVLIMLPQASMVLTGRAALEVSGGVAAEDEVGIGGYERIMAPSGQAQYQAENLTEAQAILLQHYGSSYRVPGESGPRRFSTADPFDRDVTLEPYDADGDFASIGEIFSAESNPARRRPFAMRPLMRALVDDDAGSLERWRDWRRAETAIVWDAHLGGYPVTVIGIESQPLPRVGYVPNDGPDGWTAGTLFPQSSKKVARALNAASGVRPVVILANLSGFDGSPESMRLGVLEYGAEIARAVVRFRGKLLFTVVSRYHGGAYVVFSTELNDGMYAAALSGSYASVIGGQAAAAVVFPREVRARANADERVVAARASVDAASDPTRRMALRAELDRVVGEVILEKQAEVAAEFDAIHTVERAREVGSLDEILEPSALRGRLISRLEAPAARR